MHVLAPSKCVLEKHNIVTPAEFLCNFKYFNGHLTKSHRKAVQKREIRLAEVSGICIYLFLRALGCSVKHGHEPESACRYAFFNLIYLSGCCHRQNLDLCALKLEIVFIVIASINTKYAQHKPYHQ